MSSLALQSLADYITPMSLLATARSQGITALGLKPSPGWPCKILLSSLVAPVLHMRSTQRRLLQLLRSGGIALTRIDEGSCPGLIPGARRAAWLASRFRYDGIVWDSIAWDGALLSGGSVW